MRFKPVYRLVIGSAEINSQTDISASTLVQLEVACAMEALADRCELRLAPLGGVSPALDDNLQVELGFDGNASGPTRVFTGVVTEVVPEVTAVRVVGLSTARPLLKLRVDKTYERQNAGQIVRDLAGQAQVSTETVEDGISFPAYVIDSRFNAARHMHLLAQRCGFDAYVLPDGRLAFRQFVTPSRIHVVTYGQDLLDISLTIRPERLSSVSVVGESAAGAQGDDAASWLTRNFQKGQASGGGGSETITVGDPATRTPAAATLRAEGVLRRSKQTATIGRLRILGRPEITLGSAVRVEQAPDERFNQTYQVRAVRHHLSRPGGLVTDVDVWGMP
jgi:phage protein D